MDSKQMQEGGDSSDSDVFENWTILDTEEAVEATTLDANQGEEEQEFEDTESFPGKNKEEIEEVDALKDESAELLDSENHKSQDFTEPESEVASDTDDGVSIITDSEPEELTIPPAPSHQLTNPTTRRFSDHSNDYFDSSDISGLHELPEDLGQRGTRKYIHRPNQKFNLILNGILVIVVASVIGLGVGHFLGLHEECFLSQAADFNHGNSFSYDNGRALLQKLESENDQLKLQLRQLQQDLELQSSILVPNEANDRKKGWEETSELDVQSLWNVNGAVADPDHRTESADVVGEASLALAENLSRTTLDLSKADEPSSVEIEVEEEQELQQKQLETETVSLPTETHHEPENIPLQKEKKDVTEEVQYPYNDEDLEVIQTRFAKETATPNKSKRNSENPDSFFTKMEEELNGIMSRVVDYSSNLVKSNNLKEHVATSIGVLSNTLQDMQGKVKSLSDLTAQHSIHAVDKVKKSVYKMVQNVKHTSDNLLKSDPEKGSISHKLMKGVYHLKDGLVDRWCHLKGKMARGLGAQGEEVSRKCRLQYQKDNQTKKSGQKTELHHSKSFKPKVESKNEKRQDYVEKKQFNLKMKYDQNTSYHREENGKYHKFKKKDNIVTKTCGKRYNSKCKKTFNDPRLAKQKQGEQEWKKKEEMKNKPCSQGENCNESNGEWMERLAKGRANQRQAEHESDWLFDRAKARQESRQNDKEQDGNWYLKRGKSRQHDRKDYMVHHGYDSPWVDTRKL